MMQRRKGSGLVLLALLGFGLGSGERGLEPGDLLGGSRELVGGAIPGGLDLQHRLAAGAAADRPVGPDQVAVRGDRADVRDVLDNVDRKGHVGDDGDPVQGPGQCRAADASGR